MATTVQLNDTTEWSDEPYTAYYGSESYGGDDDEGFLDDLGGVIKSGVSAVGNILTNPIGAATSAVSSVGKILGVHTSPASTAGIQNRPNVSGSVTTAGGKKIPVQVPEAAHKQDIQVLQAAIAKINSEIKQVADTTTSNGVALSKLTKEVKHIDDKHVSATKRQNELISKLGTGVDKVTKDLKSLRSQEQMNMMMSLLIQPQLQSVTFKGATDKLGNPIPVLRDDTSVEVKSSTSSDNTLLLLLMSGMMGGDGNSGGMFGDMGNNPLMMILMLKAFSGGSGSIL